MSAAYTLTWDEFAEPHQHTWPRTSIFSLVVTALIALPLIGYGIAAWVFQVMGDNIWYAIFLGGPLVTVAMAIAQIYANGNNAKKSAIAAKRAEYERSHSGAQSFSFDQEKWTHETADGRRETPWSALQTASESENTVCLTGKQIWTLVPKRVLDASTLESLRHRALPQGKGGEFRISVWDYLATETSLLWRKLWFLLAGVNLFGLAVLAWFAVRLFQPHALAIMVWGWVLAAYFVVLILSSQLWYIPLRYATAREAFRAPQLFEFSDRGVRLVTLVGSFFMAWDTFKNFNETRRAFLLYSGGAGYYLLVKDRVSTETQEQIRQILREKMKKG